MMLLAVWEFGLEARFSFARFKLLFGLSKQLGFLNYCLHFGIQLGFRLLLVLPAHCFFG
jgi:hypothetical protein